MLVRPKVIVCVFLAMVLGVCLQATSGFSAEDLDKGIEKLRNLKFKGDYQELTKRRVIRALVPYSKTFYFLDGAQERGATYELLKEFEKTINTELKTKNLKVHVVIVPTSRDQLLQGLIDGKGDIAAGNLTITPDRRKIVDFADPVGKGVNEIVVTGPQSPKVASLDDLSGKTIHVRKSSSYHESLQRLNEKFAREGKKKVDIVLASEFLEDEDLLEMVTAGIVPMVIVDNFKAKFWKEVFEGIVLHEDIQLNSGGEIAWAIRKNSPQLKNVINRFIKSHKKGTLFGNVIFKRYMVNTEFVKNNLADEDRARFIQTVNLFKKYGEEYRFDWLMLAALSYQESGINQSKRSKAGAIGVMQILPSTAKDKNIGIHGIEKIEQNIHAGTKYIRFMVDQYFDDPELDELNRGLLAFASYNAGPNKIASLRKEAAKSGLNPNVWFRNVEVIAAKRIGRETVQYVSNIFKYYTAYLLIQKQAEVKNAAKKAGKD